METIIGTALLLGMVFWVLKELFFEFSPSKIKEEGKSKKSPNEIERVRQFMDDRSKVREKEAREKAVQQSADFTVKQLYLLFTFRHDQLGNS